ncbi:hypothetical protein K2X30_11410 [bacterium]|jgi:hypothetical protein|nr:hypothetical protein [bacterium]
MFKKILVLMAVVVASNGSASDEIFRLGKDVKPDTLELAMSQATKVAAGKKSWQLEQDLAGLRTQLSNYFSSMGEIKTCKNLLDTLNVEYSSYTAAVHSDLDELLVAQSQLLQDSFNLLSEALKTSTDPEVKKFMDQLSLLKAMSTTFASNDDPMGKTAIAALSMSIANQFNKMVNQFSAASVLTFNKRRAEIFEARKMEFVSKKATEQEPNFSLDVSDAAKPALKLCLGSINATAAPGTPVTFFSGARTYEPLCMKATLSTGELQSAEDASASAFMPAASYVLNDLSDIKSESMKLCLVYEAVSRALEAK